MVRRRVRTGRLRGATGLVLLVTLTAAAACGGDDPEKAAPSAPATTAISMAPAQPDSSASGLPCDSAVFLQVLRDQGGQFNVPPAVLDGAQPQGAPRCQGPFATQIFAGPPDGPGQFPALFGPTPDEKAWALVSVDCKLSEAAGDRRAC